MISCISKAIHDVQMESIKPLDEKFLEAFTRKTITQSLAQELDALVN